MMIDPHVHCRDGVQHYKETVQHALKVAESVGVKAIFDMPNTSPPIVRYQDVRSRLALARSVTSPVFYGLYVGLTAEIEQIKEAIELCEEFSPNRLGYPRVGVVGIKEYAGHSVGDLAIVERERQEFVKSKLSWQGFKGVLLDHCEGEWLMRPELWDAEKPITHCYARPPEAEVESVKDQINFAEKWGYQGHLHITHVSVPESVQLVKDAKSRGMRISCGVTPHHCLLDESYMEGESGILYKMNPPLRKKEMVVQMLEYLRQGEIDWLETDHAPHTLEEKVRAPYMSGIPNLPFYPVFLGELKKRGFSAARLEEITDKRIRDVFEFEIPERILRLEGDFSKDYCFNPYEKLYK